MSTVAITGARGFLGAHAVREFERADHRVIRIGRDDGRPVRLDADRAPRDQPFDDVDAVVHLAAQLVVPPDRDVITYLDANVGLTERVILSAIDAGVSRFVFASSRLVYPATLGRAATEDDVAPSGAYGLSKQLAELVVEHHARDADISTSSLRISQLVGPGDQGRGVLGRFAAAARRGGPIEVTGSGRAVRDMLDVRDAARALRCAVERPEQRGPLNVGAGGRTVRTLAEATATVAGLGHDAIVHVPTDRDDTSNWSLDSDRARDELGWAPEWSLEQTLHDRLAELDDTGSS